MQQSNSLHAPARVIPFAAPPADLVPVDIDAELAVLGSCLLDSSNVAPLRAFLQARDFYRETNGAVYEAILALDERAEPIDFLTVRAELERTNRIDFVSGPSFLASLLNAVPTSIHAQHYAKIVKRKSTRRQAIDYASQVARLAYEDESEDYLSVAAAMLEGVRAGAATDSVNGAAPSRFKPLSLSELRAIPAAPDLVKGLIPTDANVGLIAPYACFKSFLLLDLGLSVAAGMPWAGKPTYSGPVVYICGEGRSKIARRVDAWGIARRVDVDALPFRIIPNMPRLMDAREVDELITAIRGEGVPVLIIFDTLARAMMGGDENSARDTSLFVAAMDKIRAAFGGPAVMYAHHEGWTGGRGRGSSNLPAALDTELRIERQGELATLTSSKQKDGDDSIPVVFKARRVELGVDEDGELITSLVLDLVSGPVERRPTPDDVQEQAVLAFVKAKPGVSENAIRKAIPPPCFTENDVRKAVRRLLLSGKVRSEEGPRNSMALYAV